MALSVPRLVAELMAFPVVLSDNVAAGRAATAAERLEIWSGVAPSARLERLAARLRQGQTPSAPLLAVRQWEMAAEHAPADADTWRSLMWARLRAGKTALAIQALRVSILTGPFDPETSSERLDVALSLWPLLGPADLAAVDRLVQVQWAWGPGRFSEIAWKHRAAERLGPFLPKEAQTDFAHRYAILQSLDRPADHR